MEKRQNCYKYKTGKKRKYRQGKRMKKCSKPFGGTESEGTSRVGPFREPVDDVYNKEKNH